MMDIAEVARRSGLPASTLRFYEEKGLIESVGRRGLRRSFEPNVLVRLSLIALGRNAGFSLEEAAATFGPDGSPRIDRAQLLAKADDLDRTIRRLSAMRDGMRRTARPPATWSARPSAACCGSRAPASRDSAPSKPAPARRPTPPAARFQAAVSDSSQPGMRRRSVVNPDWSRRRHRAE